MVGEIGDAGRLRPGKWRRTGTGTETEEGRWKRVGESECRSCFGGRR